jgi:hypothetical protein
MEKNLNIFEEEFLKVAEDESLISLTKVLRMNLMDEKIHFQINLAHLRKFISF